MNFRMTICVAAAVAFSAMAMAQQPKPATLKVGDASPQMKVGKWVKGTPVSNLKDGKIHVVEFWATWCGPCKVSIPHLTKLAKKYKGKADITGVSVYEAPGAPDAKTLAKVQTFVKSMGAQMDYSVAADDSKNTMAKTWMEAAGEEGIPTAFVIGKDGKVAWIGHPMVGLDEVVGDMIAGKFDPKAEQLKQQQTLERQQKLGPIMTDIQKAIAQNDEQEAVIGFNKMFEIEPLMEMQYGTNKFELLLVADETKAYEYARKLAAGLYKDEPEMLNNMAWAIVDDEQGLKRPDYKLALTLAQRAVELSKGKDSYSVDTLAYAYFKNGNLEKAIETQAKAVELAKVNKSVEPQTLKDMQDRLERFKKRKAAGG